MKWFKYTRYISPKSNFIIFEAKISEKGGWEVLSDKTGFKPLFEAIARGKYHIDVVQGDIIRFDSQDPLTNIRKYDKWEEVSGFKKSSLTELPLELAFYLRFVSPSLIPLDGYQPQALAMATRVAERLSIYISENFSIGASTMMFKPASAGYQFFVSETDPNCNIFLNDFFSRIETRQPFESDDRNLNALIEEFRRIQYMNLDVLEIKLDAGEYKLYRKQLGNIETPYQEHDIQYEGIPHRPTSIRNSFNLKSSQGDFFCHLPITIDKQTKIELLEKLGAYDLNNSKIIVKGRINDKKPKTIKVDEIDFGD